MLEIHEYPARCVRTVLITDTSCLVALLQSFCRSDFAAISRGHLMSLPKISDRGDVKETDPSQYGTGPSLCLKVISLLIDHNIWKLP